jgi:hypothetical protein
MENSCKVKLGSELAAKRYTDHNFALTDSSVFRRNGKRVDVRWTRISELFKGQHITLLSNRSNFYRVAAGQLGNKEFAATVNLLG